MKILTLIAALALAGNAAKPIVLQLDASVAATS